MSVTIDTNILVYAANPLDAAHADALDAVERLGNARDLVTLFWPVIFGFLRITTNPRIRETPASLAQSVDWLKALTAPAHVRLAGEPSDFLQTFTDLVGPGIRGDLVPDAHIAALMRRHGVRTIYTRDRDFRRFDGIDVVDPCA